MLEKKLKQRLINSYPDLSDFNDIYNEIIKETRKEYKQKLWFTFHREVRNILGWGLIIFFFIAGISMGQIIPVVNFILFGGVIIFLDYLKYR